MTTDQLPPLPPGSVLNTETGGSACKASLKAPPDEELDSLVDSLRDDVARMHPDATAAADAIQSLRARVAELEKDARRYRAMRLHEDLDIWADKLIAAQEAQAKGMP